MSLFPFIARGEVEAIDVRDIILKLRESRRFMVQAKAQVRSKLLPYLFLFQWGYSVNVIIKDIYCLPCTYTFLLSTNSASMQF